jgi:Leucine-rich repeat (LRR) protein
MNQPHMPISMDEMNPNIHNESPSSGKGILLNLASLLVLIGIVGITAWLYIQNKMTKPLSSPSNTTVEKEATEMNNDNNSSIPSLTQKESQVLYGTSSCKKFDSIEEALRNPESVCVLDLTGKNIKALPPTISGFKNLSEIYLTANQLESLPKEIGSFTKLRVLYAPGNKIKSIPTEIQLLTQLETLNLTNNQLSSIPEQLSSLPKLSTLLLSNNNLTTVPDSLTKLPLARFDLYENDFSKEEIVKIKKTFEDKNVAVSAK